MVFNESVIYTLIFFTTAESPSVVTIKTIQREPLKAKGCVFSHSCMAETWARNILKELPFSF